MTAPALAHSASHQASAEGDIALAQDISPCASRAPGHETTSPSKPISSSATRTSTRTETVSSPRSSSPDRETEAAQVLLELAFGLPFEAQVDLARLLEHSLAEPLPGLDRSKSLGLFMRMVRAEGAIPTPDEYDLEHAGAVLGGEDWPDRRSLCRRFGSWMGVVRVVTRLLAHAGDKRVPRSFKHGSDRPPRGTYSNPEVTDKAIIACWQWLGDWPTEWEYFTWAAAQRAAARAAGKPLPLYPTRKPLRTARGDFATATAFAYDRATQLGLAREELREDARK
jgi:hypothetical protein